VRVERQPAGGGWEAVPRDDASDNATVRRALENMAPWIAAPEPGR
jgi:hypothetical protein